MTALQGISEEQLSHAQHMPAMTARAVGQAFADLVRAEPGMQRLFVSGTADQVSLWLFTEPISHETQLHLHSLRRQLLERFPDMYVELQIEHAGLYDADHVTFDAPAGAEPISFSPR